jgi:hypothetical protein
MKKCTVNNTKRKSHKTNTAFIVFDNKQKKNYDTAFIIQRMYFLRVFFEINF